MSKKINKQSGMTMIEVLVSLFMIGALIVIYAAAWNVVVLNRHIRNENVAYHIASNKMEELRATPYASLPASNPNFAAADLSQLPSGVGAFTVADYAGFSGIKEFTVTVSWNDGRARSVQIRTLAGTGGINP